MVNVGSRFRQGSRMRGIRKTISLVLKPFHSESDGAIEVQCSIGGVIFSVSTIIRSKLDQIHVYDQISVKHGTYYTCLTLS